MNKLLIISALLCLLSCAEENLIEQEPRPVQILTESLQNRFEKKNETIRIIKGTSSGRMGGKVDAELTLIGELAPPSVDGDILQATSVERTGDLVLVSYNFQGEEYLGALDLINKDLELKAQIVMGDADINQVMVKDKDVYIVGSTSSLPGYTSFIERIELDKNNESFEWHNQRMGLGSYVANSVFVLDDGVFVTSGNSKELGGGLYKLSRSLDMEIYRPIQDARWVTGKGKEIYTLSGDPGYVMEWEKDDLEYEGEFYHNGNPQMESKITMDVTNKYIYVAGGHAGLLVYDDDGEFVQQLEFSDNSITNAVSAENGLVFISNGEGGIYIADHDKANIEVVGKLDLDFGESVNHIELKGKYLYVASGVGGVKLIELNK